MTERSIEITGRST